MTFCNDAFYLNDSDKQAVIENMKCRAFDEAKVRIERRCLTLTASYSASTVK